METRETLLLFGGTFAPPHFGHIHALRAAMQEVKPSKVLVMPSGQSPHKRNLPGEESFLRLEMCRAAFSDIENVQVSDYEIKKLGYSYTADTLAYLTKENSRIWLLYGSDMFLKLGSWQRAEQIFSLASVVCMPRKEDDRDELLRKKDQYTRAYGTEIRILEEIAISLSSTQVRKRIADGEAPEGLLPESVMRIIQRERLYI